MLQHTVYIRREKMQVILQPGRQGSQENKSYREKKKLEKSYQNLLRFILVI